MSLRIAVDAMGGDFAPRAAVQGAFLSAVEDGTPILLVGRRERLERELARLGRVPDRLEIVHADEVVAMDETATAVRRKRQASVAICAEAVRDGRAQAMISAGNTGAAMVAAKLLIGALPGVDRPALAASFPNRRGRTVVLDVGANVDSRPEHLRQFAVMGHFYAQEVVGISAPRIGLLSIGEEEAKGSDVVREAYGALAAAGLNFVGNVEGRDVFNGNCDVVVCDGFVGNVLLKAAESMAELIVGMMREELLRDSRTRLGGWLARPAFLNFKRRTDYTEYGAVPLLGVRGGCFIGHGRSNAKAIRNAIRRAVEFSQAGLNLKIGDKLAELHAAEASLAAAASPHAGK
jgi:glycerol-3-phosphate acyltransferase PlsX